MNSIINVGASEKSVLAAHKAVMDILNTRLAEAVLIEALRAFTGVCSVNNTTISNCTMTNNEASGIKTKRKEAQT